jgi:hypothetical protein
LAQKIREIHPFAQSVMQTKKAAFVGVFHQRKKAMIYFLVTTPTRAKGHRMKGHNPRNPIIYSIRDAEK